MVNSELALSIANLDKTYANGVNALTSVNLSVPSGDLFALLGPNGAGKTTLIGCFNGLVDKTGGQISVSGYDIDSNPTEARACVSLMPQEFNFNGFKTVKRILIDNAGYYGVPYRKAKQKADHWLDRLGLLHKRDQKAMALSGGMKRRLMLARTMMNDPKILVLDEPTAGVDIELRLSLWELVKTINREEGVTVILTTHYLEEAENLCRQVAIIDNGQIIENAPINTLLDKVNSECFVLHLTQPIPDDIDIAPFHSQRVDDKTIEVSIQRGQYLNDVFSLLSKQGIMAHSIRSKRNRLEQLFIELTKEY